MLGSKKQLNRANAIIAMLVASALVLVLNIFSARLSARWDATENSDYRISSAARGMLTDLDDVVNVKAYFTAELPGYLLVRNQEVRDLLTEFEAASGGNVQVVFLDPSVDPDVEQEAKGLGIPTLQFNVVEKDAYQVTSGYLGLAVFYGDNHEIIPLIQDATSLEYDLAAAISKVTREKIPVVGIANFAGAVPATDYVHIRQALENQYTVRDLALTDGRLIPDDVDTLVLFVGDTAALNKRGQYLVDQFLMAGGSVLSLAEGVAINRNDLTAEKADSKIGELLAQWGIRLNKNLVLDVSNELAGFRTDRTQFFAPYPLWVKVGALGFNPDSGIVNKLESAVFSWASSLDVLEEKLTDKTVRVDLARTTNQAWAQDGDWQLNPQLIAAPSEGSQKSYVLASMLSGHFESFFTKDTIPGRIIRDGDEETVEPVSKEDQGKFLSATDQGRLLVVGDTDFALDASTSRFEQNKIFFANLVDALTTDDALIAIRSKAVTDRPLRSLSDSQKAWIRWGNIFGVPVLFALYGLARFARRRSRHVSL
ncbi:MAG: GldG family protein [Parcubacteria group bacterium]|nr:GldG family protein [Parcubacteria group bacterium]